MLRLELDSCEDYTIPVKSEWHIIRCDNLWGVQLSHSRSSSLKPEAFRSEAAATAAGAELLRVPRVLASAQHPNVLFRLSSRAP